MRSNIGIMYDLKSKLKLPTQDIKDLYTDAISNLIWNVQTNKFKGNSKLTTYLFKIFHNKSVDHLRHISTNKNRQTDEITSIRLESGEDLESDTYNNIAFEQVKSEIKQLGSECKNILMDWAYWGYNMKEIATRNNLESANKAKKSKYSCLQKLREMLKSKNLY